MKLLSSIAVYLKEGKYKLSQLGQYKKGAFLI